MVDVAVPNAEAAVDAVPKSDEVPAAAEVAPNNDGAGAAATAGAPNAWAVGVDPNKEVVGAVGAPNAGAADVVAAPKAGAAAAAGAPNPVVPEDPNDRPVDREATGLAAENCVKCCQFSMYID